MRSDHEADASCRGTSPRFPGLPSSWGPADHSDDVSARTDPGFLFVEIILSAIMQRRTNGSYRLMPEYSLSFSSQNSRSFSLQLEPTNLLS